MRTHAAMGKSNIIIPGEVKDDENETTKKKREENVAGAEFDVEKDAKIHVCEWLTRNGKKATIKNDRKKKHKFYERNTMESKNFEMDNRESSTHTHTQPYTYRKHNEQKYW